MSRLFARSHVSEQRFVDIVYQPVRDPSGHLQGIFVQGADVTDRIAAERAVRQSEARNRQILDSAVDYAILAVDTEGKISRWNEGARRILGWTEQEMLGHDASCIDRGEVVRMLGVVQDVTQRKADQRAIEESAAQFHTFAQTLPNHAWTSPPDGLLDWFNDQVYAYSGAARGALDGSGWAAIVHPDDLSLASERWAAALATGALYETEFRLRRADDEFRWHLVRAVPIRTADGSIKRWVGTNTDMHERKLAEAESTRDRDRIWTLSQEMMLVCDYDGVIAAANPAATRLLGWSAAEMIGRPLTDLRR